MGEGRRKIVKESVPSLPPILGGGSKKEEGDWV